MQSIRPFKYKLPIRTGLKTKFINISPEIDKLIQQTGIKEGLCIAMHNHSTAGLILNSKMETATLKDLEEEIDRLIPTRIDFHHTYDTPRDAAAHVKAMIVGHSVLVPIAQGKLDTGQYAGIIFCEFDGPRDRVINLHFIPYSNE